MNKTVSIFIITLITLIILIIPYHPKTTINFSSFTKAICNDSYCQDYIINCENDKTTSIITISGAAIQFDKDWKDPRTKEQIEKLCG